MGKIFDALQRYDVEKSVAIPERLPILEEIHQTENNGDPSRKQRLLLPNKISPKLFVCTAPDSIDAEIFNVIKGHILYPKNGKPQRSILVTSAFPGEGKTLVSANLAVNIAMGVHESVLLIDCDLRHPSVHKMFGYKNHDGLHEILEKKRNLEDLLIETNIEKLTLLTAGEPSPRPADLLGSSMMNDLLADMKNLSKNHFVILDGVPTEAMPETSALANHVDGIVFVIRAKHSPRKVIRKSIEKIGKDKILGIVFNGFTKAYKSYSKYYAEYYRNKKL